MNDATPRRAAGFRGDQVGRRGGWIPDDTQTGRHGFVVPERGSGPEASVADEPRRKPRPSGAHDGRSDSGRPRRQSARSSAGRGGRHTREPVETRPRGRRHLRTSIFFTFLSTLVPGLGLIGARKPGMRLFGVLVALSVVVGGLLAGFFAITNQAEALKLVSDTTVLTLATPVLVAFGLVWVLLILLTHLATRPPGLRAGRRFVGALAVVALTFAAAAPTAVAARYTRDAYLLLSSILPDDVVATSRPTLTGDNPWADKPRVNFLLLGADGDASRAEEVKQFGVRTDTIIVASIDTSTGDTTLIQIPRNVQNTPFPRGSEMAAQFPDGFRGEGPEGDWYINSIWPKVELEYPDLMAGNTYRGAEALKLGVEGVTGLKMDYFMMLNIDGVQELIDAMGGVTVNINERLPIGGSSSNPVASDWLEQGPDQHLNGFQGLWYARSRWSTDDYDRMRRQSCLVNAIVEQANPTTIVTRFEGIAAAGADMVKTDIPSQDAKAIIDLAMKVKDATVKRLVFSDGKNGYSYVNPDFRQMRAAVEQAIDPQESTPKSTPSSSAPAGSESPAQSSGKPSTARSPSASASEAPEGAENVTDACAYNPVEE